MKVYVIMLEWSTDDCSGVDLEIFDTYKKAVNRFDEILNDESDNNISWTGDAWDENGDLLPDYELDCNDPFTDGEEHELWWTMQRKNDWCFRDNLELKIMEVK